MKKDDDVATRCQGPMRLIHIGPAQPNNFMNVRQIFEQMAYREGEMIRELRERAMRRMIAIEIP